MLLSSLHSLHVESAHETDVKVAIKHLCGGWKIASTNPQVREAQSPSLPTLSLSKVAVHGANFQLKLAMLMAEMVLPAQNNHNDNNVNPVSYTHLTLPTKLEV